MCVENAGSGLSAIVEACQRIIALNAKHQAVIEHMVIARLRTNKTAIWLQVHGATELANDE